MALTAFYRRRGLLVRYAVLDKVFVFLFCTREIHQYEGGIRVACAGSERTVITLKNSDGNHGKPFSKNVKLILLILCRSDMSRMQNEQHLVCVCVCGGVFSLQYRRTRTSTWGSQRSL